MLVAELIFQLGHGRSNRIDWGAIVECPDAAIRVEEETAVPHEATADGGELTGAETADTMATCEHDRSVGKD